LLHRVERVLIETLKNPEIPAMSPDFVKRQAFAPTRRDAHKG
jgi:hypothetical protein